MANLIAIVKATRASARAVARSAKAFRALRDAEASGDAAAVDRAMKAWRRVGQDRARAASILAANPLPGDAP